MVRMERIEKVKDDGDTDDYVEFMEQMHTQIGEYAIALDKQLSWTHSVLSGANLRK